MKADIKLTITRLTPVELNALLGLVASNMDNNPAFPDPQVPIADLRAMHARLTSAISEATDGSKLAKLVRNGIVREAMDLLRTQANYVRSKANGDAIILNSSGFSLQRERQRIGRPEAPLLTVDRNALPGTLKLRWNRVRGARVFKVFLRIPGSPTAEMHTLTTSASHVITGLQRFHEYDVCVSALGTAGESEKSMIVTGRAA